MYRIRQEARQRRELERMQMQQTSAENELLREAVREQAARIANLELMLSKMR
jgi:hypothetical protein